MLTVSVSCKKQSTDNNSKELNQIVNPEKYNEILGGENTGDYFKLINTDRQGEVLFVEIQYSGGCETHTFNVYWDGKISESNPPQASIILTHNANNDRCEAWFTGFLEINLKDLFGEKYSEDLVVNVLNGYGNTN